MKKVVLSAAALFCGMVLVAQQNESQINQHGTDQGAIVVQLGQLNKSDIVQRQGEASDANIFQVGTSNSSKVLQVQNRDYAGVIQIGESNKSDINQIGMDNRGYVVQLEVEILLTSSKLD